VQKLRSPEDSDFIQTGRRYGLFGVRWGRWGTPPTPSDLWLWFVMGVRRVVVVLVCTMVSECSRAACSSRNARGTTSRANPMSSMVSA